MAPLPISLLLFPALLIRLWSGFTWLSLVDILLVSALVYRCLVLVRGTRASQVLVGLLVLVGAFYGARFAHLTTLYWLLSRASPYFVFAVIILFQTEIRQGLSQLGRHFVLAWSSRNRRLLDSYEDIVLAANYFSVHRVGALVVVENKTGLRTYIESGVMIDALLTYDLLVAVFRPGGPLHDGAVIIQQNRVSAAACFLPLSMNPVLSGQLGTRHRAAIGITEETDAVAIVVSETTGAVSFAKDGKIEMNIGLDRLRDRLSEVFQSYVPPHTVASKPLEPIARNASRGEWRS